VLGVLVRLASVGVLTCFIVVLTWLVTQTVLQVVKFADAVPEDFRAYTYTLMSLGGGFLLGMGIYGWSVWA